MTTQGAGCDRRVAARVAIPGHHLSRLATTCEHQPLADEHRRLTNIEETRTTLELSSVVTSLATSNLLADLSRCGTEPESPMSAVGSPGIAQRPPKESMVITCQTHAGRTRHGLFGWFTASLIVSWCVSPAGAQQYPSVDGRQFLVTPRTAPGVAGQWALQAGQVPAYALQAVRIALPTAGQVTFYPAGPQSGIDVVAPAQAHILVGQVYRLRISQLPEYPGLELYPSVELISRLHPPPGQADRFPVIIELLDEEIRWAAEGRMITKVVYLEQPNRVLTQHLNGELRVTDVPPSQNAVAEADVLGRPIAIVRLGGRTPDRFHPDPAFFGPGGVVNVTATPPAELNPAQPMTSQSAAPAPGSTFGSTSEFAPASGAVSLRTAPQGSAARSAAVRPLRATTAHTASR
jgi:hypothetical protein